MLCFVCLWLIANHFYDHEPSTSPVDLAGVIVATRSGNWTGHWTTIAFDGGGRCKVRGVWGEVGDSVLVSTQIVSSWLGGEPR